MSDLVATLRELCGAFGPPGFEDEVRGLIRPQVEPLADEVRETILGNLIVTRRGADPSKTLLIDAHMDEVGLIVTHVEENGFLRFATIGSIDPRVVPSHQVVIRARDGSKRMGVIGIVPPHVTKTHDRARVFPLDDLAIDLGCFSAQEVEALGIGPGAPAVIHSDFALIEGECLTAKALDDRSGCALLIGLLQSFENRTPPVNLVGAFTVQEETGGMGAHTAADIVAPEAALVLEGTTAVDTPGVPGRKRACSLGKGPAVTVADARTIVPEKMIRFIENQAETASIPYQIKTPRIGGTDAHPIQHKHGGVLTGVLSTPCRYIHSSTSVLHIPDLKNTLALLVQCAERADALWL